MPTAVPESAFIALGIQLFAVGLGKPLNRFDGVSVRWKDGIEDVFDLPSQDDERALLQQPRSFPLQGRQVHRIGQRIFGIRQQRKRQVQTFDDLALTGGVLGRQTIHVIDTQRREFRVVVAKRAGLRRTTARPRDQVPTGPNLATGWPGTLQTGHGVHTAGIGPASPNRSRERTS